jgi:hypothetical protein
MKYKYPLDIATELSIYVNPLVAQVINCILLFFIFIVALLILKDAMKYNTLPTALMWAILSLVTFPFAPAIYLCIRDNNRLKSYSRKKNIS